MGSAYSSKDKRYWFKPKRYGYGAYPHTWEGWALILVFLVAIFMSAALVKTRPIEYVGLAMLLALALIFISYHKTDGEWKWRWGDVNSAAVAPKKKKRD